MNKILPITVCSTSIKPKSIVRQGEIKFHHSNGDTISVTHFYYEINLTITLHFFHGD